MIERKPPERHALTGYSLFALYFLLIEGPLSGYDLAQLIKERTPGHFRATAGNVYPRLHELKEAGALYEDREVVVDANLVTSRQPADLPAFMRETMKQLRL